MTGAMNNWRIQWPLSAETKNELCKWLRSAKLRELLSPTYNQNRKIKSATLTPIHRMFQATNDFWLQISAVAI